MRYDLSRDVGLNMYKRILLAYRCAGEQRERYKAAPGDNPSANAGVSQRPNIARLTLLASIVCLAPTLGDVPLIVELGGTSVAS